jgi:hypothetical protein
LAKNPVSGLAKNPVSGLAKNPVSGLVKNQVSGGRWQLQTYSHGRNQVLQKLPGFLHLDAGVGIVGKTGFLDWLSRRQ